MGNCIDSFGYYTVYSALGANWRYWKMPITKEYRDKKTFVIHRDALHWIRMPLRLRNAPDSFQQSLNLIHSSVWVKKCLMYVPSRSANILTQDLRPHQHLDRVYKLPQKAGTALNIQTFQLLQKSLDYLGDVSLPGRIVNTKDSTSAIADAKFLDEMTQLHYFLGACNVHRCARKFFREMAESLNPFRRIATGIKCPQPELCRTNCHGTLGGEQTYPSRHGLLFIQDLRNHPPTTRRRQLD